MVCDQILVIAARHVADAVGDRCMALIDVVADGAGGRAGALADCNGNGLAVGQVDHDRATGDGCVDSGGVEDGSAFGHRWCSGQRHCGGVLNIGDRGADGGGIGDQVFIVAAADGGDVVGDWRLTLIDIVAHHAGGGAGTLTDGNGDGLPVGQADHHWATGDGGIHTCGVNDGSALGHGWRGRQGDCGGVRYIRDAGADRRLVSHQVFVISAGHIADAVGHCGMALIDVVGDCSSGGAGTLPDRDGDGLAVGQGDHDGRTCDRCGDRGGVDDGPAFGHRWRGGQAHGRGVDGIRDIGHRWGAVDCEVLKVAARCIGNAGADLTGIQVGVIAVGGNADAARGLVSADGDGLAVTQGDGHRRLCGVGQGGGVHDLATFSHARRRRQRDGGGVLHVCDTGADGGLIGD